MEYRPCTAGGHHNVTSLNLKGDRDPCSKNGFREVFIRCNGDEVVEFIRVCFVASILPMQITTDMSKKSKDRLRDPAL